MADISTSRKRRWWLVLLILLALVAIIFFSRGTIKRWSWELVSRNFDGWDIAATSKNNIFVVGNRILHFNGLFWHRACAFSTPKTGTSLRLAENDLPHPPSDWPTLHEYESYLCAVTAYDATHVYAVGEPGILRYNGLWWSRMPSTQDIAPHPFEIWVQNPDSIYALDDELGPLYWDGQQWDVLSLPGLVTATAVGGTEDTVFITGDGADGAALFIQEDGQWTPTPLEPILAQFTLDLESPYLADRELEPQWVAGPVYGLDDGRVITMLSESEKSNANDFRPYLYSLQYEAGTWSIITLPDFPAPAPCSRYYASPHITTNDQGALLVYSPFHTCMKLTSGRDGSYAMDWRTSSSIGEDRALYGVSDLIGESDLFVYGSRHLGSSGRKSIIYAPCSVEHYELAWWRL